MGVFWMETMVEFPNTDFNAELFCDDMRWKLEYCSFVSICDPQKEAQNVSQCNAFNIFTSIVI